MIPAAIGSLLATAIIVIHTAIIAAAAVLPPQSAQRRLAFDGEAGRCERALETRGESVADAQRLQCVRECRCV